MSEAQKTCDVFLDMITALTQAADHRNTLRECIYRDAEEIKKLNDIIDELRDEKANMQTGFYEMVERSGFDLSPCIDCGESVVCIPEGLALCKTCAAKGGEA